MERIDEGELFRRIDKTQKLNSHGVEGEIPQGQVLNNAGRTLTVAGKINGQPMPDDPAGIFFGSAQRHKCSTIQNMNKQATAAYCITINGEIKIIGLYL